MSTITVAELRSHFETDLADGALQSLLGTAAQEIESAAGSHASHTDYYAAPDSRVLVLRRPAASITSVHERVYGAETVLTSADWRMAYGREMLRLNTGPNPRTWWGDEVIIVYVPVSDLAVRRRVQIDLCKLSLQYSGAASEKAGDYSVTLSDDYQAERDRLLSALTARTMWLA